MEQHIFDLHTHSNCSDGTMSPTAIVKAAKESGLSMVALSDHDWISGIEEALQAGRKFDIKMIPAVEFDCEYKHELHMLGADIDPNSPRLVDTLSQLSERRTERNRIIVKKLQDAGYDISQHLNKKHGVVTRMHMALALCDAGFAEDVPDAFRRYLNPGKPGYYPALRCTPAEAVEIIKEAGGIPVLAHPCNVSSDPHGLLQEMMAAGIEGVEVYHPSASAGQAAILLSIARQNNLIVTCGSDFHGGNRKTATLGCMWRELPDLEKTYQLFLARCKD